MKFLKIKISSISIILIIIIFSIFNKKDDDFYNDIKFEKGKVYLFFRETNSKVGEIAKSYNINKTNFSHVGIGSIIDNKIMIVHILPNEEFRSKDSQLHFETIKQFYHPKKDSVKSAEILRFRNITPEQFKNFEKLILELKSKKITFDKNFTTKRDSSYYCSELVEYILETIDENFRILPIKKKLVKFDQFYLQRDSIEYYPVDIFMNNKNFVHIKSK